MAYTFRNDVDQSRRAIVAILIEPDPEPEKLFVITAFDLGPKALRALKRSRKKKLWVNQSHRKLGRTSH